MVTWVRIIKTQITFNQSGWSTRYQRDPTRSMVVIWVKFFQTESKVEIYSKSLVGAIGKVLLMKFS